MDFGFRYYQKEADEAIYDKLLINNKCIVKMFCGTGKSRLMRYCRIAQNKKLVVYVVPSLSLIEQFYTDYFIEMKDFPLKNILRISSEEGSTTDKKDIVKFLKKRENKIICVTYQSFETLINSLGDTKIDVCIFDEAHHAIGKTYQSLIFETDVCEKQIFFTATPKNANGVIMYDKDNLDSGMCGKLVYDYSYFKGVMEGYLNPFEIRIDFYTENTNASVYESIARAVLASGNSRVLTFHADVNGDSDTSVLRFVNEELFIVAFNKVLNTEFPEKIGYYKRIKMIGLSAVIDMKVRKRILSQFDTTPDDEVFIISSCQTIGEGIDTKNANMCVFVDPKSSIVGITQNIGRIVRRIFGLEKPNSTILIPCWVDKEKYLGCDGDKDKCDEVIREDMNKEGNFNGILNVMSALKQEDEDLFDACLNYPSTYSPQEIEGNLAKYGYQLEDPTSLVESLEHILDTDIDLEDEETDEELLARTAEENNVVIEVHTNSLETPVEYYGQEEGKDFEVIRIFKSEDEETGETAYQPIVKKDGTKRNTDCVEPLRRENRFNVKVHTNPDVKVLWNLKDDFDLSKDICGCIIDCEVVDMWPQRFEELKVFIDENKHLPHYKTFIGRWYKTQQANYKKITQCMKNINKYTLWREFIEIYKIYLHTIEDIWYTKFENLKQFIVDNKRTPNTSLKEDCEEKTIGHWYSSQKTNYKSKTGLMKIPQIYNVWTQFKNYFREFIENRYEKWEKNFKELETFIKTNKRRPSSSKNENNDEKYLAKWTCHQKTNYTNKFDIMKEDKYKKIWETFYEQNKQYLNKDDKWRQTLETLKEYIDTNNKNPTNQLNDWAKHNVTNYKERTQNMGDNDIYKSWNDFIKNDKYVLFYGTDDDKWNFKLKQISNFIDTNQRMPSRINNEMGHYSWIANNKNYYKNNKCGMELDNIIRRQKWENFINKYNICSDVKQRNDDLWTHQFEELITFIKKEKHKPSQISSIKCIAKLGKWLSSQKQNYKNKNKTMANEERYNLWTQFSKEYLDDDSTTTKSENDESKEEEFEIIVKPKQKKSANLPKPKAKEEKVETKEDIRVRTCPLITQFHNKYCKMRSDNMAQHFKENPSDFAEYHQVRDENMSTYNKQDIPCERIIQELDKIKSKKGGKTVVDMGCGTAKISEYFKDDKRFQFINYDHVAINESVQVCDISHMPLEDDSIDICIMSLALWGSNCEEYIQEAFRVLDSQGTLYIIDSTKRWSEKDELQNIILKQEAIKLKHLLEKNNFNIVSSNIDKWCLFKCTK
jgi:superfamily II DNA or RNA helicase/ubiquinone/menaquinone biosynthesis C-methylase UbiE